MRTTKHEPGSKPTPLHTLVGMLAFALICCSLLCIFLYMTTAHASSGSQQANGKAMSGQVVFDETETNTPPPTVTSTSTATPWPSATGTSTATPWPSATGTSTPPPTSTRSARPIATVQHSSAAISTQTPSPGATPTSSATSTSITMQGPGANQTPVSSSATTSNLSDQLSQGAHLPNKTFPFSALMIGLGSAALLGLLFIPGWMIVRRSLLTVPSPKLPPSGAAPWSRTLISDQEELQFKQGYATNNATYVRMTTATPGSNPPASLHALPTVAAIAVPNLPVFSLRDDATLAATSPSSHTNPPAGIGRSRVSSDSSYLAARIRQRRNELRATDNLPASQKQTPGELSAEITELSDPYLQSLIKLYHA